MIHDIAFTRHVTGIARDIHGNKFQATNMLVSVTGYWCFFEDEMESATPSLNITVKNQHGETVLGEVFQDILDDLWASYYAHG